MVVRDAAHPQGRACVGEAVVHQVADELVRGAVVGEAALIARGDEPHPSQPRQMVTRPGQRQTQRAREIPHGELVMCQRVPPPRTQKYVLASHSLSPSPRRYTETSALRRSMGSRFTHLR